MTPPASKADALIEELVSAATGERDRILETADSDGADLIGRTRRDARKRMHAAILALRSHGDAELRRAEAELQTAQRYHRHAEESEALKAAWSALETALADRWHDPATRRRWITAVLADARRTLHPGPWTIHHPRDWDAAEAADLVDDLAAALGAPPNFAVDDAIAAGLRIRAENATLDATADRLVANRALIEALLLAELGRSTGADASSETISDD